ncbi:hypothetical protein WJX73_009656 [Symbiochloris irregularis]|uniref:Pyridine nucleotide-disulphide oxidoreductase dimerisation domain-containing protein n=1 Tax=Symbiochloris irregularis TaxID=706552 RepID=A0AAW1PM24_9CHLO
MRFPHGQWPPIAMVAGMLRVNPAHQQRLQIPRSWQRCAWVEASGDRADRLQDQRGCGQAGSGCLLGGAAPVVHRRCKWQVHAGARSQCPGHQRSGEHLRVTTCAQPCLCACRLLHTSRGELSNSKALAEGEGDGMAKMIYRRDTGEILGVHIFGLHAADLIHEASNAISMGSSIGDIKFNVHAHPTLSEVLDELFKQAHVEGIPDIALQSKVKYEKGVKREAVAA